MDRQVVVPRPRLPLHEIYQYLAQKNFNLSSDRVLKDPQANSDVIWNILVFLSNHLKDTKYDQIQPTLMYMVDAEQHKQSLKRIKQYICISDVLKKIFKTGEEYPIKEIMKPEKDAIYQRISMLIHANRFVQKVSRQYQNQRTENKLKKQFVLQLRKKLQTKLQEIEQMKAIKEKQKIRYQQKVVSIQNISKQIAYKKKQKLDLLDSQQSLDNELKKKVKILNDLGYMNQDIKIKIMQLDRQVIKNAPKLKKQRNALIQQYDNILKKNREQFEMWDKKVSLIQQKIQPFYGLKQKSKTFKIQNIKKQIDKVEHQLNTLNASIARDEQNKHETVVSKKQLLKNIQKLEKDKKQLQQNVNLQQRQLKLLQKSQSLLMQDQRKYKSNVKIMEEKNNLSINQYKTLEDKIKYRNAKLKQRIFELHMRLKDLEEESKNIIEQTFAEFN